MASSSSVPPSSAPFSWCVVGAGPAGIACVGQLLDKGVPANSILWVDPSFSVGDFGTKWRSVSSNTTVALFRRFCRQCKAFGWREADKRERAYRIDGLQDKDTCRLDVAAEPLRDITSHLLGLGVRGVRGIVRRLGQTRGRWAVTTAEATYSAESVVLALGAEPNRLAVHEQHAHVEEVPLTAALDPKQLAQAVRPEDTVVLVGSSHTAIIILRHLLELTACQKVINLYKLPLRYAMYMDGWILFDDTGLKGSTAAWARSTLHGELPPRLVRAYSDEASMGEALGKATKVIYATGFHQRLVQEGVEGVGPSASPLPYNARCGILAPGLFGAGIGFPEERTDRFGNVELRVGLWKFMEYLEQVVPVWMQYNVQQQIGQPKGAPAEVASEPSPAAARPLPAKL